MGPLFYVWNDFMITINNLTKKFGGFTAVNNASLTIEKGSITGLVGPNGAGKTTLFNVIAGVYKPSQGTVFLDGKDITGLEPHQLFHRGLLRTFQIAHEFSTMTVRENLMMVPGEQSGEKLLDVWLKPSKIREEESLLRKKADEVIEFLEISHVANELAGNLSGGQKKLLELGRTMMVDAKIVFLDEVGAGVNRTLLNTIGDAIIRLNKERGLAAVCFLGGSLVQSGGADPFEAAALGSAILHGPYTQNYQNDFDRLLDAGGARLVYNSEMLSNALVDTMSPDRAATMAHAAWEVCSAGAEVNDRIIELLDGYLEKEENLESST